MSRFRVIGVMEPKGQVLGFDLDDTVYIPTARALEIFNREGLMEIHIAYQPGVSPQAVVEDTHRILVARHGREDFTVTPQQKMLDTLSYCIGCADFCGHCLGWNFATSRCCRYGNVDAYSCCRTCC